MLGATSLPGLCVSLFGVALVGPPAEASALQGDAACAFNSLTSPGCWSDGYSLSTNWYDDGPDTGVVREYWFEVTNVTAAPDGYERVVLSINGSVPGPTIYADWGDTVVVHLHNGLADNGTSIHWHGIRQFENSQQDGVASITQCPLAPGLSTTYIWKATQYGTTWYHSHFSMQAWNGVFGGIVINGPASAPYTKDKGVIVLSDWFHQTTDALELDAITNTAPMADNGLINGTNVSPFGGFYFNTTAAAGDSYRLRLINSALDTTFKFGIDNHTLTVISNDLVPIVPYNTDFVTVNIGQRYDVIVAADQDPGNYWIRALVQNCSSGNAMEGNITGIFHYDSVPMAEPNSAEAVWVNSCTDELPSNLVPFLPLDVGKANITDEFDVFHSTFNTMSWWTVNGENFYSDWGNPTLQQVMSGVTAFKASENVNVFNESNAWVYFVIESTLRATHPIHLHGHDFLVLGSGTGSFVSGAPLLTTNPPRRDVTMLPGYGWLVIAWPQDNPGVWLLHCHIGWHIAQGLALQLVEQISSIEGTIDASSINDTCSNWNAYAEAAGIVQFDSGI